MTATAPDSVQCPVCFKDFTSSTINRHLDVCLLKGDTESSPTPADQGEPPPKKPRTIPAACPGVNNSATSSSSSTTAAAPAPPMFSLFQANKSKTAAAAQAAATSVNKGVKRSLPGEAAPGAAGTESQPRGSKAPGDLSPRRLMTIEKPLAELLRPNTLEEYFGQSKVVGEQTLLRSLLDSQEIPSLLLWGPPGCGKVGRC